MTSGTRNTARFDAHASRRRVLSVLSLRSSSAKTGEFVRKRIILHPSDLWSVSDLGYPQIKTLELRRNPIQRGVFPAP